MIKLTLTQSCSIQSLSSLLHHCSLEMLSCPSASVARLKYTIGVHGIMRIDEIGFSVFETSAVCKSAK